MLPTTIFTMEQICRLFGDTFTQYMKTIVDEELRMKIARFCAGIVAGQKAYLLLTPTGLKHAISVVFEDTVHHDFVMSMSFVFFATLGNNPDHLDCLFTSLARGVSPSDPDMEKHDLVAIPKQYQDRYISYPTALTQLKSNRWLVILLMMQLSLSLVDSDKVRPKQKAN